MRDRAPPPTDSRTTERRLALSPHEVGLGILLLLEVAAFAAFAPRFFTVTNGLEILRLSVEIGLLALAQTLVVVTGGIDLSVGSLMGLCAVVLGKLWRDGHAPIALAAVAVLAIGGAAGAMNALFITRLKIPPLIVTLGGYSLFRGIAEGLTGGVDNFTGFPAGFLELGQGYLFGVIPTQLPLFACAAMAAWLLLQRSRWGRTLRAVGHSAEGARHAALPVDGIVGGVYLCSGLVAAVAAVVYVAHLGQAKADAGTGYELLAITAVVLGGTSIFGGSGTVQGTLAALLAVAVLQNGLRLAALPAELAGILVGVILVVAVGVPTLRARKMRTQTPTPAARGKAPLKNSQLAILSAVILLGSLLVAASNWLLVRSIRADARSDAPTGATAKPARRLTIAMMPKAKGDPYFVSCRKGAEEAAREVGVDLLWDGPTELDPAMQNEVIETWITRQVDVIAVSVENRTAISTVLRKARSRGIKVVTWDADADRDARDFLVNQATPRGIGQTLADQAARILGERGDFAIVTASLTADNQNEWIRFIKERVAQAHPDVHLVVVRPSDGDRDRAFSETSTILKVYPSVRVVMAIAAPAVPGAAEAVKQSGRTDVKVTGLSLPNMGKPYIRAGVVDDIVLWNTLDLGYLTVMASNALGTGALGPGASGVSAGRLGRVEVVGDEVRLGAPFVFTKENVEGFDF